MKDIPIELIDTNEYRNHKDGKSHIVLLDDRLIHEAISKCDCYIDEVLPKALDYYIRESYKKESISGVSMCNEYHEKIGIEIYGVTVCAMGTVYPILLRFMDRAKALEVYQAVARWIFDDK